jgi:hypothetical protein
MNSESPSNDDIKNSRDNIVQSQEERAAEQTSPEGHADSETSVSKTKSIASSDSLSIPETFGRYAIQKVLGQGAM